MNHTHKRKMIQSLTPRFATSACKWNHQELNQNLKKEKDHLEIFNGLDVMNANAGTIGAA